MGQLACGAVLHAQIDPSVGKRRKMSGHLHGKIVGYWGLSDLKAGLVGSRKARPSEGCSKKDLPRVG